jgi:sulfur relay (sulfurtransferase) DsrC/TusE family protein
MCIHVKAAFDWLQIKHGNNYFESFKDWDKEKAKLLEEYGLKPEDEEVKEVEFYNDYYGNLKMKVPAWLWGKHAETSISDFKKSLVPQNNTHLFAERPKLTKS